MTSIPALASYMARIGAEELNFRRYMVKEHKGNYYTERVIIKVNPDGTIECANKDYLPTKEEAERIKGALMGVEWPRHINARNTDNLKPMIFSGSQLFEFRSDDDQIIMCQERTALKQFLPWTFWSDGEWRRMEPEGALPFWRPRGSKTGRIMIHEGAKAASHVDNIVRKRLKHPWLDELSIYDHWGMIGGALAPHRTDYAMLRKYAPQEVVYVCDNDWPGKSALQEVSKHYGGAMKGVMFDHRWPESWDMADEPIAHMPPLITLVRPATFATEKVLLDGKKPTAKLRQSFKQEWLHSITPEVFIHKDAPNVIFTASEFNSRVAPFSDVDDTARLLKKDETSKAVIISYNPSVSTGIVIGADRRVYMNTHVGPIIEPNDEGPGPFVDFLSHLIPDPADRHELMRWCATLIARPDIKMLYGVLLISETQGIGKGTLGEKILAPLVGIWNTSFPNENEIVNSNYNYWCAHRRLAIVHEIYAGHSAKGYNQLKSIITDKYITVSKKFQANYEIENWMHVFACSNSKRALKLSDDDRRWFVPAVSEFKKDQHYWTEFNHWLNTVGLGAITAWAEKFLSQHSAVIVGAAAPWTTAKSAVIAEGLSPGQTLVVDLLDRMKKHYNGTPVMLTDTDCVQFIKDKIYDGRHSDRLEKPATLRKLAKARGWFINEQRAYVKDWGYATLGPRLICSDVKDTTLSPGELDKLGKKPKNINEIIDDINGNDM